MNALDDGCKCVLVLVAGEARYADVHGETAGYHVVCALPESLCATSGGVQKRFQTFCEDHHIAHTACALSDALRLMEDAKRDGALAAATLKTPLTVVTAPPEEGLQDLLDALLLPSPGGPYCLVAVLDLTHLRGDTRQGAAGSSHAWLVPEQSYVSELKEFEGSDAGCRVAPLHMYCCYPLVRDCGMQCSVETFMTTSSNKCTFDSILRELAFKAGQVPKYGN
ncbi:hypothetical protein STCU_00337 [Strigomonas culicis]|uniref:Uncharacterized protein n=1 Tax=Strigomonas culicis TaxID=28005 RepID=S9V1F0_9TRYP|nr:hypothetical protein STCU_06037 [Strigomonas culicis]EPY36927.1 hypothetical protein STCU_00337 [Strigomonas culicis]|eukprot:EPY26870.1 hypothetical protein STCU_06037 [Strigomonas culicis]